ncbi:hypothetical protein [Nocardia sp. NBC_00511]
MSSAAATGSGMYIWGPIEDAIFGVICAIVPGSAGSFICPAPGVK